jgi:hypothetical protein
VFRSAALPAVVCSHCNSMLARSDAGVAVVGVSAPLPFDVSPVQLGVHGTVDAHGFDVIGRIRWGWVDGSWNEWLMLFDDGTNGWLSDAMGEFMVLRQRDLPPSSVVGGVAEGGTAIAGTEFTIAGEKWTVTDARDVICLAAEGELPFQPRPGYKLYSVDLKADNGDCASLQRDEDETTYYQGRYLTLAELAPKGLRTFDGWAPPAYAA